jgi:uncharacterized metal-binding protein
MNSTLLLQQESEQLLTAKQPNTLTPYIKKSLQKIESSISYNEILTVYIKACTKVEADILALQNLHKEILKLEKSSKPEDKKSCIALKIEKAKKHDLINNIIKFFISQFSVCYSHCAVDLTQLLHGRFDYIKLQVSYFIICNDHVYLTNALEILKRTIGTFNKMSEVVAPPQTMP